MTESLRDALSTLLSGERPQLVVIAGSNGAGKTTFYEAYLDAVPLPFVNSDRIAKQIAPDDPAHVAYEAARIADQVRRSLLDERRSFIMETVFSDPEGDELAFLREATDAGYAVVLLLVGAPPRVATTFRSTSCSKDSHARWPILRLRSSSSNSP